MKPQSKRLFIVAGGTVVVAGVVGLATSVSSLWLNLGCIAVGGLLIVQALIMGRKPPA